MGRYTLLLLLAGCQPIASSTVLQTDSIRFGTGSEDSIQVGVENIQQPFAFIGGAFTKLTYSANSMDFELQAGGSTATACLGFDSTDESGFIGTSSDGTNNFGIGSISATKTCSIGGATLSIDWTFTLSASNSKALSLAITVSSSGAAASDVQVWWGTRDDWVGTTDRPAKEIGSITSGSSGFTSAAGTTGNAVQVTSGSEGLILFSASPGARALRASCCNFDNLVSLDPQTTFSGTVTDDGSYGLFLPLGTIPDGGSASASVAYAAGAVADLATVIAEAFQAGGAPSLPPSPPSLPPPPSPPPPSPPPPSDDDDEEDEDEDDDDDDDEDMWGDDDEGDDDAKFTGFTA
ncbi:hypothetical protein EMIHUDRAFT_372445 [Emiliania huxleyi CCMP1516]|uniref:DOMON domain-containing protein n=2 Tax=Emiliania huxleyi TaxID=2903 RepID=A0A0D3I2Q9_EMIH1|nr:hypothetical protein EMIHUDRAFT_372445 [Emiliania huxleyi CCMP1516]EOD05544.1 hypothetical protein EMIHUDRAFT_372445 [Emiliania huxleyi CCMP1516]|eukprot:XP_005757973.1 hypothetical protein EMIHUDRAFT_372445 [Emiliania huxleyi CCMP1516]